MMKMNDYLIILTIHVVTMIIITKIVIQPLSEDVTSIKQEIQSLKDSFEFISE